jgi:hypothetical protein
MQSQLFTSISSESPIGEGHVSLLTSDHPGSAPEDPMAFVELPAQVALPIFTKQMQVISIGHSQLKLKSLINYYAYLFSSIR